MPLSEEQRARTLARFEEHRRAWERNPALRALYAEWYGRVAAELPPPALGPRVELGSGPGFARRFIPDLELSDIVRAPWHDRELSAEALPFGDGALGALVLFDVLHHLPRPRRFFEEASRALAAGGRIVMCEPYVSPLSFPVYKLFHEEPLALGVDPLAPAAEDDRDPFDSNQAIPTLLFGRRRRELAAAFPRLTLRRVQHLSGPSYPASGGFSRGPLLPAPLWSALHRLESWCPEIVFRLTGFRMLVVLEKTG
ncbi:MAG TPA: methyltransferase domain-containing protein [Polyangia bacterium]|nr:methyltransferase domain-containing protein [Polyangia bacterium]